MPSLPLTFACGLYDRMVPLYTGEVKPEGIDLNFIAIEDPRQIFDRMGGGLEFDASEMSSSEFISKLSAGKSPFVALPVFASRVFPPQPHFRQPQIRHPHAQGSRGQAHRRAALHHDRRDLHPRPSDA